MSLIKRDVSFEGDLEAPISEGDKVGSVTYTVDGETICQDDIVVCSSVEKILYFGVISKLFKCFIMV